jgi:hypothetical protein
MNWGGAALVGVALALAALAVDLGAHAAEAGAAGAAAIALATLGILRLAEARPAASVRAGEPNLRAADRFYHRDAFHLTPLGRERILATLDRLDRRSGRPGADDPSGNRRETLRQLPPDRFREYVRGRIEALENGP